MILQTAVGTLRRIILVCGSLFFMAGGAVVAADASEVPVINGGVGSCSATFTVKDVDKKPIYNAKIEVVIRYGFLGLHKNELQIGTNSDGKARVIGLPEKVKKPLEFRISSGDLYSTVEVNPTIKCDSTLEVVLEAK